METFLIIIFIRVYMETQRETFGKLSETFGKLHGN
jgi:hypothetical protein